MSVDKLEKTVPIIRGWKRFQSHQSFISTNSPWITTSHELQVHEGQVDIRCSRRFIGHIFTILRIFESCLPHRRPTIIVFMDIRTAFDSVFSTLNGESLVCCGHPRDIQSNIRHMVHHHLTFWLKMVYVRVPTLGLPIHFCNRRHRREMQGNRMVEGFDLLPANTLLDLCHCIGLQGFYFEAVCWILAFLQDLLRPITGWDLFNRKVGYSLLYVVWSYALVRPVLSERLMSTGCPSSNVDA